MLTTIPTQLDGASAPAMWGPMATWGFEVDPGRGSVTVRQWARMGPARSGLSVAIDAMPDKEGRIVARRLVQWRDAMAANLAAVRTEVGDR